MKLKDVCGVATVIEIEENETETLHEGKRVVLHACKCGLAPSVNMSTGQVTCQNHWTALKTGERTQDYCDLDFNLKKLLDEF